MHWVYLSMLCEYRFPLLLSIFISHHYEENHLKIGYLYSQMIGESFALPLFHYNYKSYRATP